jgi:hypothetical protein
VDEGQPEYEQAVAYWCLFQGHPLLNATRVYDPADFKPGNDQGIIKWFPLPE